MEPIGRCAATNACVSVFEDYESIGALGCVNCSVVVGINGISYNKKPVCGIGGAELGGSVGAGSIGGGTYTQDCFSKRGSGVLPPENR